MKEATAKKQEPEIKVLTIPEGYNEELILEWVNPEDVECQVLAEFTNESNYCLFVKESWGDEPKYRFYRIFVIGGRTQVSVDYESNDISDILIIRLAANYLNDKFGK